MSTFPAKPGLSPSFPIFENRITYAGHHRAGARAGCKDAVRIHSPVVDREPGHGRYAERIPAGIVRQGLVGMDVPASTRSVWGLRVL
jgi:hypothetical protein